MKEERSWGMIHPAAKCMALFFHRMREQSKKTGTVTVDWMGRWGLQEQSKNSPYAGRNPTTLDYLRRYDMESVYLAPRHPGESGIGGVGNKKVTSKFEFKYQRLDGEADISCRQQVSAQSQGT
jgi:hypothetical protein